MSLRTPKKASSTASSSANISTGAGNLNSTNDGSVSESRKRQSKRDDAIRRRVENDLNKKRLAARTPTTQTRKRKNYEPGSVLSLKPSEAVVCKPSFTAYEAAQLMSAKRENCILVVDDNQSLLGIFTAKDLAFRVVSKGLNAGSITIDQIMTPNPLCATSDTQASEALGLMVERGFRHLPVIEEENSSIVGVLDITKCYQEAMEKLERMYESSRKLHDALQGVHAEIGLSQQPAHVVKYFENLKSVMSGPTLDSVLDENTLPSYVNVKTSVYEASVIMKENHTTAVLVKDSNEAVTGIFTSKDVVLRVIAAGLDPKTVSVIRVMTSQPDVASKDLTIQAALRKMFDGHYLNLPVVEDDEIIGIVEVLKLTYATLHQITSMKTNEDDESGNEGPAWNKFWTSLDETESVHSDSAFVEASQSDLNQFTSPHDNLGPGDSVSVANESRSQYNQSTTLSALDVKDVPFSFKFKSPTGRNHRISFKPSDGILELRILVSSKLNAVETQILTENNHEYAISYIDDESDVVAITNDQDLIDCVLINRNTKLDKADLFIHHPESSIDLDEYHHKKSGPIANNQIISGVANEVVISGAIVAIGALVVIAFSLGKK